MNIYQARLDTEHYSFEAYGSTRAVALVALDNGIRTHCRQIDTPLDQFKRVYGNWRVVREIELGTTYRDRESLARRNSPVCPVAD